MKQEQIGEIAWIDGSGKKYRIEDITDRHLINILRFVCDGGGYITFLNERNIKRLFDEAKRRRLKHNYKVQDAIHAYYSKLSYECQVCTDWW